MGGWLTEGPKSSIDHDNFIIMSDYMNVSASEYSRSSAAMASTERCFGDLVGVSMNQDIIEKLEHRLGRLHARQRLGIEDDHEGRVFGQGINFFHPENWYCSPAIIRGALKVVGLYGRARRNAEDVQIRRHDI